ncbi:MAG: hypothetical protein U1E67_05125 [Hyphomicrobiales bacterium]
MIIGGAPAAKADPRNYCIAYARDLANRKVTLPASEVEAVINPAGDAVAAVASISQPSADDRKKELLWRRAYQATLKDCLEQFSHDHSKPIVTPPQVIAPAKPAAPAKKPEEQADASTDGPKKGSEAWKKKCLADHPSFNAETGTYRTYSGAQRECRPN